MLPKDEQPNNYDSYRIEFSDGRIEVLSDLELSPAGSGPTVPVE